MKEPTHIARSLWRSSRHAEAVEAYRQATDRSPVDAAPHAALGHALRESGRLSEAVAAYSRAIDLRPDHAATHNDVGVTYERRGRPDLACAAYERAAKLAPRNPVYHSNLLLALHYLPGLPAEAVRDAHVAWARRHTKPATPDEVAKRFADRDRDPDRILRVGYVSPDLRGHASAAFLEPLLTGHDPAAVEVVCFSDARRPDHISARIRKKVSAWHDTGTLDDAALAELIRADRIDVLVESVGHAAGNRLRLFARRPAPIQVVFPNYPNTTGLVGAFDALVIDDDRAPAGSEPLYTEPLVRIPVSAQCYRPPQHAPAVAPNPPCEWNGFVTFASLNRLVKVTPGMMQTWGKILRSVPMSRLAVLAEWRDDPATESDVRERFANAGVPVDRLDFIPRMTTKQYLAFYSRVDVLLDTHPCNGHTTTLDATWMGVPTVTLAGQTHVSREGLAVLKHVGLEHLVTRSEEEYIAAAIRQASRRDELTILRRELRGRLAASPLSDGRRVATELERVYRDRWRRWCAGSVGASNT